MGKYSSANLLEEELEERPQRGDFLGRMINKMVKTSNVLLTFQVPVSTYLRAEIFCEDIMDLAEDEANFTQEDLIDLLYYDFLHYAKKNPNPKAIHSLLVTLHRNSGKVMNLVNKDGGSVYNVIHRENKQHMQTVRLTCKRKLALRGEVLLADMEEVFPNHGFTLEDVLEYLYCDFINKFRTGDNSEAVKTILRMLDDE